jgi:hypothetical protein
MDPQMYTTFTQLNGNVSERGISFVLEYANLLSIRESLMILANQLDILGLVEEIIRRCLFMRLCVCFRSGHKKRPIALFSHRGHTALKVRSIHIFNRIFLRH